MKGRLATFGMLAQIAMRNLFASRLKTLIIGGIILFGAILVVVGSSLLDSIEQSMSRSIIGSIAGNIQIYSAKSKEELALWGSFGAETELAEMDNFATIKTRLESLENVERVIPMGISGALVQSGNTIDLTLAELREAINAQRSGNSSASLQEKIESLKAHVRQMCLVLHGDMKNLQVLADQTAFDAGNAEAIERAISDAFWAEFDQDPLNGLEFLENRVAPLTTDADLLFLRYAGTDMDAFARSFDRMRIVDGEAVPTGHRGFLFSKFYYEEFLKLKTARRLDKIKEGLEVKGRTLATDPELQRFVKANVTQVREIALQLDSIKTRQVVERLQAFLGSKETGLEPLLGAFFQMDDANFEQRYPFFYSEIAPLLTLYRIPMGGTLTIKAFTRSGFVQSINIKVYGTFEFEGLEKSTLAGSLNLMDIVSFRELYGYLTTEKAEEIARLKASVGVQEVSRDSAEEALFGGGRDSLVAEAMPGVVSAVEELEGTTRTLREKDLQARVFAPEETNQGVVLNAAVILKDPKRLDESILAIQQLSDREGLGVKAVSWQQASGLIGQFVLLLKLVLYAAVFIIFVVALVVINNAMMMATLERVREIGTLRAIGAQRRFVLQMVMIETVVVGLVFGGIGAVLGTGIVALIAHWGIPATSDVMYFFFSGPRLRPELASGNLLAAFIIVLMVSALSSFYPAWLATRVSPLQAMQTED